MVRVISFVKTFPSSACGFYLDGLTGNQIFSFPEDVISKLHAG